MSKLPENQINGGEKFDPTQKEVEKLEKELETLLNSKLKYTQLNRIDKIIKRLDEIKPIENNFSKNAAWNDFKDNYLSSIDNSHNQEANSAISNKKKKFSVAFCVICIFIFVNIISVVAGVNIFTPLLNWTSDVLNLKTHQDYTVTEEGVINFDSVSDLEDYLGQKIPTLNYLPEGFKLYSIETLPDGTTTITYRKDNNRAIKYKISPTDNNSDISLEKTKEKYLQYDFNNTTFYYFKNTNWSIIEWYYNNNVYYISGDFSDNEIIKIIENIKN